MAKPVHVVTVNDYLAMRDAAWMGPVYQFMGLTVGCLRQNNESYVLRRKLRPQRSRTRGTPPPSLPLLAVPNFDQPLSAKPMLATSYTPPTTNSGFDYLRDHMVGGPEDRSQNSLAYAIVDEVDNILIDEARTPLLISGPGIETDRNYSRFASIATRLKPELDFEIDLKRKKRFP